MPPAARRRPAKRSPREETTRGRRPRAADVVPEAEDPALTVRAPAAPYDPGPEHLVLVGLTGPGAGIEFTLTRTASTLGRGPGVTFEIEDPQASRRHLKLVLLPDPVRPARQALLVQDLQSTNGVRVEGRRIQQRVLRGGEKLMVGQTVLRFERRDSFDAAYHGRLQQMALTDPLTGLGNRLALDQELERQEGERIRYGRRFSLLVMDLDHFKAVNDKGGHAAGDRVLRHVATVLLSILRDPDHAYRFGGEEFVAVLTETDRDGARVVAQRLREEIEDLVFPPDLGKLPPVTASVGVAQADDSEEGVLARADRALYEAKRSGRNRVCVAP
jgi:diguanylate cyclase (GGDEF)-like protein